MKLQPRKPPDQRIRGVDKNTAGVQDEGSDAYDATRGGYYEGSENIRDLLVDAGAFVFRDVLCYQNCVKEP